MSSKLAVIFLVLAALSQAATAGHTAEDGCYGLPAGSRLIIVNVPLFQLKVALAAGGAKIVSAMPYFD